jgi:uncharacterized membrane-anchored protein YhcB (DUF1043 family)
MDLGTIIGLIVGMIILILIVREVFLWYWRVNEAISNQNKTNALLEQQNEILKENNEIMKQFVDDFANK